MSRLPTSDALQHQSVDFTKCRCFEHSRLLPNPRVAHDRATRALTHGVFMNDVPLSPGRGNLCQSARQAAEGYDTGYVGKWHLNGDGRSAFIPRERRQGFDYWKALECTHTYNNSSYYGDTPQKVEMDRLRCHRPKRATRKEYLRSRATNDRPFLFMLSWGPPHSPYNTAPQKYREMYNAQSVILRDNVPTNAIKRTRADLAGYYAHCTALDDCVGDLMQTLREAGLEDNTIVIFTSDHGDMIGSHGLHDKQKSFSYDESIQRVPLVDTLAKSDSGRPARSWMRRLVPKRDFMPTLLGLCKVPVPKTVEGSDYSRYIHGGANPSDNAAVISVRCAFCRLGPPLRRQGISRDSHDPLHLRPRF